MHVFSKRSFLCRHIAGIGSIFLTGFLPGICSKFLSGFLPKFLVHIPGRIPARNLVQIPGRIPANLNISLQIPQGVHTDSCRNLYKKNQIVKGIPARNLVSFSCGNTAVFLLDNFVRRSMLLAHKEGNIQPSYHVLLKAIVKREKIIIILINTKLLSIKTILHCTSWISANDFTYHQMFQFNMLTQSRKFIQN